MRRNMMRMSLMLSFAFLMCITGVLGQNKVLIGTVKDSVGHPVVGAMVKVEGKSLTTTTGEDGTFQLSVGPKSKLLITSLGYQPYEYTVDGSTEVSIVLEAKNAALDEVVVTALGISRNRNTLPYAAQQISGEELNKAATNLNPVSNLAGKISGLQITQANTMGGSTNVILRGMKSLTQSNQALFVIDGVPYDNGNQSRSSYDLGNAASDINPDDIESVNVLKGAAASALYGSRASNGVVMITTKKGTRRKTVGVSVSMGVTVGTPINSTLPTYQTEYGQGYGGNGAVGPFGFADTSGFFYNTTSSFSSSPINIVQTNNDAALGPAYNSNLMVYNWDAFTPGDPNYGKATPWVAAKHNRAQDYFVTPVTTQENVSINKANENGMFRLSYTRDDDKDFMPNSHLKKNQLSFASDYKLTDRITVGGFITYSGNSATNRYLYPYSGGTSPMTDFRQWWPTNVDIKKQKEDYFSTGTNATWNWQTSAYENNTLGNIGTPTYHDNLYWFAYQNPETDSRERYFGNVHVDYKITSYLSATARVSRDYYNQTVETRNDVGSQSTPYYTKYLGTNSETNYFGMLNFNKDLGEDFNLKALFGGNVQKTMAEYTSSSTNGGLVVPGYFALANSVKTPSAPSEYYGVKEIDGIFAGATLDYKSLLSLDGTIRRDKSSTLPTKNNTYYYPSVSLNFQFAKLLQDWSWLSNGKVWGNFAEVGGDAPLFSVSNTYYALTPFNGENMFTTNYQNNNPNLKPEKQKSWEVGLSAGFLNNRIGFSADYYHSRQDNQLMATTVSAATGYTSYFVNGGSVQNSGFEVTLNLVPIRSRNFHWNMDINWSKNNQKVLSLYNNQPQYVVASYQNSIRLVAEPGKAYQLQGTDYVYKNGQRVIDANGYYEIADNQYSDLGTINPNWIGGVNNSFSYKNWTLSFLVDVRQGGNVYSLDMDYGSSSGLYPRTAGLNDLGKPVRETLENGGGIILKGVHEDGTPNTTRIDESDVNAGAYSFSSAYGEADREFVYSASYIKLRQAAITYSLPASVLQHMKAIQGLSFSLTGNNLWIIHKNLPYADPEQGQASGNASMGFQNGAYPLYRMFGAVVKVNF